MKTITSIQIVGEIDGTPDRKTVKDKPLTEFRIAGVGLRCTAWEARSAEVPNSGTVIVNGYLNTRNYEYEGKQREAVEIRVQSIQVIAGAVDSTEPF